MVQYQIKLRPSISQGKHYDQWLFPLASVYNWAVRKIELKAQIKIYFTTQGFENMLADHGPQLGIPSPTLQGVLGTVHDAWKRCFKKLRGKPRLKRRLKRRLKGRLKGKGNRLSSIPFPDPIQAPKGNRITLPGLGRVRFHQQELPAGKIKCGRLVKRATGTQFIEVASRNSTRTCHQCGSLSGPTGLTGLSVRHGSCPCGTEHDRDVHAALKHSDCCGRICRRGGLCLSQSRITNLTLGVSKVQPNHE